MKYIFHVFFFCLTLHLSLQGQAVDKNLDPEVRVLYNKARKFQLADDHLNANKAFRQLIALNKKLPQELTYYFALSLYNIGQYQNANNFVQKYLDLQGKKGDFFEQVLYLQKQIKKKLDEISNCQLCNHFGYRYTVCTHCLGAKTLDEQCPHCRGVGTTVCPTCKGQGVIVKETNFDVSQYLTCPTCNLARRITCPVCLGKTTIQQNCPVCLGSGVIATDQICDHQEH